MSKPDVLDDLKALRTAELERRVEGLAREVRLWKTRCAGDPRFQPNHSQIKAISLLVEKFIEQQRAALGDLATEFATNAYLLAEDIALAQGVWDFFRDKLELRYNPDFQRRVAIADTIAWSSYDPVLTAAMKLGVIEKGTLREPPLTYLAANPFAQTWQRGTRPHHAKDALHKSEELLAEESLPIPVIELPWDSLENIWELLSIPHEVGHDLETDLGIGEALEASLSAALDKAGVTEEAKEAWLFWRPELVADFIALQLVGSPYADYLLGLLLADERRALEDDPEDAKHPTRFLRILLASAYIQTLIDPKKEKAPPLVARAKVAAAALAEDAAALEARWRAVYPKTPRNDPRSALFAVVIEALMDTPLEELRGVTLRSLMPYRASDDDRIRARAEILAKGEVPDADKPILPRFCLAAAGRAASRIAASGKRGKALAKAIHDLDVCAQKDIESHTEPGKRDLDPKHAAFLMSFTSKLRGKRGLSDTPGKPSSPVTPAPSPGGAVDTKPKPEPGSEPDPKPEPDPTRAPGEAPVAGKQRVDRALLIGIDAYEFVDPPLSGCVNDVDEIQRLLVESLGTPEDCVVKLTARLEGESPAEKATRDNIIEAFKTLAKDAKQGEQIYVHYAGHGVRNDGSILPGIDADGRDEAIVATDTGYEDPAKPYILDKELGFLLKRITDKGAFVTVVMDCCHSATGTRDIVRTRRARTATGTEGGDPRPRTEASLVAPLAELRKAVTGDPGAIGALIPAPAGYVLLAACRENETAKELQSRGAFSTFLAEALEGSIAGLTYRDWVNRAAAEILSLASSNANYENQTPSLEGDGDLILFGGGRRAARRTMLATPLEDGTLKISGGGAAVGMANEAVLALYPPDAAGVDDRSLEIGLATVFEVSSDSALAYVTDIPKEKLSPAMKAILVQPGTAVARRRVAIGDAPELAAVRSALEASAYVELTSPRDACELVVAAKKVGNESAYVILDYADNALGFQMRPIAVASNGSVKAIAKRVEHIVRYLNAWQIRNRDASDIQGRLAITVVKQGQVLGGKVSIRVGEQISIEIHNRSTQEVNAALFYFGPDGMIQRMWPEGPDHELLAPTGEKGHKTVTLKAHLPDGQERSLDRLKLFATSKSSPTSFDALTLPAFDKPVTRSIGSKPKNALEALLSDVDNARATRNLQVVTTRPKLSDWGTAEIEIETIT